MIDELGNGDAVDAVDEGDDDGDSIAPGPEAIAGEGSPVLGDALRPIVMGEDMTKVRSAAAAFQADVYDAPSAEALGFPADTPWSDPALSEASLGHNNAWLLARQAEGRRIIDIGPAEARPFYPMATSSNYAMESNAVRDYANIMTPWRDMRGAPGFPWSPR